jgi:hypothetical protein
VELLVGETALTNSVLLLPSVSRQGRIGQEAVYQEKQQENAVALPLVLWFCYHHSADA